MLRVLNIFCLISIILMLMACDQAINKAGAKFLKMNLKAVCGKEDTSCIKAVEDQFDACHEKYEKGWNDYMDSSLSEEDELLEKYSKNIYACITDENGEALFEFNTE